MSTRQHTRCSRWSPSTASLPLPRAARRRTRVQPRERRRARRRVGRGGGAVSAGAAERPGQHRIPHRVPARDAERLAALLRRRHAWQRRVASSRWRWRRIGARTSSIRATGSWRRRCPSSSARFGIRPRPHCRAPTIQQLRETAQQAGPAAARAAQRSAAAHQLQQCERPRHPELDRDGRRHQRDLRARLPDEPRRRIPCRWMASRSSRRSIRS